MSRREFDAIVAQAVDSLPDAAKKYMHNLVLDVEEEPDEETLLDVGFTPEEIEDGATLYGLFAPMRGFGDDIGNPRRIVVYKRPLEEDFPRRVELIEEIRKTVLH